MDKLSQAIITLEVHFADKSNRLRNAWETVHAKLLEQNGGIPMSKPDEPIRFRNHYKCSECGTEWQDEWSCMCNDRCPNCNTETEPHTSEDIEDDEELGE